MHAARVANWVHHPKVMLEVEPERRAQHIADIEALCGDQIYAAWAHPGMVEFMRRGVNKGVALQTLTERVGGCAEARLGDRGWEQRLAHVASCGNRVVLLGNATDEVKAAVAEDGVRIGPGFAEDGFAKMVREYATGWTGAEMMQVFCGIALCVAVVASALAQDQAAADSLKGGEMVKIEEENHRFYIDKYEVTNEEYAAFLTEKGKRQGGRQCTGWSWGVDIRR